MKKILSAVLLFSLLLGLGIGAPRSSAAAETAESSFSQNAKSCVLMDATTGEILFAKNEDLALPPASVTKIMTLLLVMEAWDSGKVSGSDPVTVSREAASMGGSQVFLEEGECLTLEELLKCVVIASANDAAYALAEYIAGSEEAFVARMNERAAELGMKNTFFETCTGLDDTAEKHLISAKDIAIMSRELIGHEKILSYTTIWQDTIRDGAFTLTNTNRLVRFYPGATGLKTGSTSKALFCISATAKRNGMHLIAVVMGAPTRDIRNAEAKKLLDYGFAEYALCQREGEELSPLTVTGGSAESVAVRLNDFSALLKKGQEKNVEVRLVLPRSVSAPIAVGDCVGYAEYSVDGTVIGKADVLATEEVASISFLDILLRLLCGMIGAFER